MFTIRSGLILSLLVCQPLSLVADDIGSSDRPVFRDDRPDSSRGWVILTKSSLWPLCYEPLESIERVAGLIGSGETEKLTDALDKASAWLSLTASAAGRDERSGIGMASGRFDDAAVEIRDGSEPWPDEKLQKLVNLGYLAVAKSHVLRADKFDEGMPEQRASATPKPQNLSKEMKEVAKEIAEESRLKRIEQYRYDTNQAYRHLVVAQKYLVAAKQHGGVEIDDQMLASIEPLKDAATAFEMSIYFSDEIRNRIAMMTNKIEAQRQILLKDFAE